jgi:uncharacterized protein DUF2752
MANVTPHVFGQGCGADVPGSNRRRTCDNSRSMQTVSRTSIGDRIALALASGAIAAALVAAWIPRARLATAPLCWSVILLHRQCPGCGLTRSFAAIGRGSMAEANALNPLGPILFAWALAVIAIRFGKRVAPRFRYWAEVDVAFAATAGLCVLTRTLLFYFG